MSMLRNRLVAAGLAAAFLAGGGPAYSASLATGAGAYAGAQTNPLVTQVRCRNCNTGAAVGVGIAAGILGAAAIAGAMSGPSYGPPVVYEPTPVYPAPVYPAPVYPAPVYRAAPIYAAPPVAYEAPYPAPGPAMRPTTCWYPVPDSTEGYWGPC